MLSGAVSLKWGVGVAGVPASTHCKPPERKGEWYPSAYLGGSRSRGPCTQQQMPKRGKLGRPMDPQTSLTNWKGSLDPG